MTWSQNLYIAKTSFTAKKDIANTKYSLNFTLHLTSGIDTNSKYTMYD